MFYSLFDIDIESDIELYPVFYQSSGEKNNFKCTLRAIEQNLEIPNEKEWDENTTVVNPNSKKKILSIFSKESLIYFVFIETKLLFCLNLKTFEITYKSDRRTDLLPLYLASKIIPFIMNIRGFYLLHASCVCIDGKGIAFCAPHGGGKSTVAAALCTSYDFKMISDDILPIFVADQKNIVIPSSPHACIWRPINNDKDFYTYQNIGKDINKKIIFLRGEEKNTELGKIFFLKITNNAIEQQNIFTLRTSLIYKMLLYQYFETGYSLFRGAKINPDGFMKHLANSVPCFLAFVDQPLEKMDVWCTRFINNFV
jgi:hypothetical protein